MNTQADTKWKGILHLVSCQLQGIDSLLTIDCDFPAGEVRTNADLPRRLASGSASIRPSRSVSIEICIAFAVMTGSYNVLSQSFINTADFAAGTPHGVSPGCVA